MQLMSGKVGSFCHHNISNVLKKKEKERTREGKTRRSGKYRFEVKDYLREASEYSSHGITQSMNGGAIC